MNKLDLGAVTAYAMAVEKGYEGTEEEFAALQAESGNNAVRAEAGADRAQQILDSIPLDFQEVSQGVATLTEDIANQIPFTTYCYNAHFIKNQALGTGVDNIGSVLTQLPYDSVRSYISIDCSEGDVFDVCGENSSEARLWCFLDAQDVILARIKSYEGKAAERIVAPENASRLVVNTNFNTVQDSYVVKISAREIAVDEQFSAVEKTAATLAFESLLLENGSINYDGSLSPSNERVRTMEYIHGKQSIKCPDGIVCRFIIYYKADTLEYDSYITSDSAFFTVGKDGCVAKLTFMRSAGGELYVDNLRDGLVEKTIKTVGKWLPNSPYWRDKNFGCVPAEYYKGIGSSYEDGFGRGTKYADYIAKWKALIGNHAAYVKETELGAASDGQKVYMYDFKPVRISDAQKGIPKIIIVGGQHGFEKSSVFGLYYFVKNLLTKWAESPALNYLRNHVELMIVPVLNTYGFDNFVYKNANGVNLNRNYDCNWGLIADTTSSDYGGAAPFDQPESRMVRDLVLANNDAVLVIDFHTNGGSSVANYSDITFYGITPSDDRYYNRMLDVFDCHIADISAHFDHDYALEHPDTAFGYLAIEVGTGQMRGWVTDNNVIGIVAEGFNGFPGEAEYVPDVYKANEEIIVNLLAKTMKYLQEVAY